MTRTYLGSLTRVIGRSPDCGSLRPVGAPIEDEGALVPTVGEPLELPELPEPPDDPPEEEPPEKPEEPPDEFGFLTITEFEQQLEIP